MLGMNSDEIESLVVKIGLLVLAPLATKYHIDGNTTAAVASGLGAAAVFGYGIWAHWNMKKVPETATVIPATPK